MNIQENFTDISSANEKQVEVVTKNDDNTKTTKPVETRITGWTSLREFSVECGITYEAVRQQVQKHSAVLEGHIKTIGKTRYLDSYAKKFLRGKKVNAKEPANTNVESLSINSSIEETSTNNNLFNGLKESTSTQPTCVLPLETKTSPVIPSNVTEMLNSQKKEIAELNKKIRSLEDEIKQIEYDNVLAQSVIASMNVREFKNWKSKFKSQMRDTMDI